MADIIEKIIKNKWLQLAGVMASIMAFILPFFPLDQNPKIVIKVLSEETILNSKPLENFSLNEQDLYNTELDRLLLTHQYILNDVKLITLSIENVGKSSISENLYDTQRPLGIGFGMGRIISIPNFIIPNKELKNLLEKNCKVQFHSEILFPKIALNSGEKFEMQILVSLYSDDISIYSFGKIACQDSIPIQIEKTVNDITIGSSNDPCNMFKRHGYDITDDTSEM